MRRNHFGRPRFIWKNHIKMDVTDLSFASVCYCERVMIHIVRDRMQWWAVEDAVTKLLLP